MAVDIAVIAYEEITRFAAVLMLSYPRTSADNLVGLSYETFISGHPTDVANENGRGGELSGTKFRKIVASLHDHSAFRGNGQSLP
jgi:hypothetical protein